MLEPEAFKQGQKAYNDKIGWDKNPYNFWTTRAEAWLKGWNEANEKHSKSSYLGSLLRL